MRILMLIATCLFGANAWADAAETRNLWLLVMTAADGQTSAQQLSENAGVTKEGAEAFVAFAQRSIKDVKNAQTADAKAMCSDRIKLKASRANFADALKRNEDNFITLRDGVIANIGVGLSASDAENLKAWALESFGTGGANSGMGAMSLFIRAGHGDHVQLADNSCDKVADFNEIP